MVGLLKTGVNQVSKVLNRNVLLENCSGDDRPGSEEKVVESQVEIIVKTLARKSIEKQEKKLGKVNHDIFVVKIQNHFRVSNVGKFPMEKKQSPECFEFR